MAMATAVATPLSPPPLPNGPQHNHQYQSSWISHSVNRSTEFLSAARTAFKILQQQHHRRRREREEVGGGGSRSTTNNTPELLPKYMENLNPMDLELYWKSQSYYDKSDHFPDDALSLIRDSQTLLHLLDEHLAELHTLVRRRGHTNDPTIEIQSIMEKFQESAKELKDVCDSLRLAGTRPYNSDIHGGVQQQGSTSQRRKHYEMLSQQLENQAKERTDQLKKELETRSQVLRDQSHRRKLLASGGSVTAGGSNVIVSGNIPSGSMSIPASFDNRKRHPITSLSAQNTTALKVSSHYQSPLFTATTSGGTSSGVNNAASIISNTTYSGYAGSQSATSSSSGSSSKTGEAIGGYVGYGGTFSAPPSYATGMRQRKQQVSQQQQQLRDNTKSHIQIDSGGDDDDTIYSDKYNKKSAPSSMTQQILIRREQRATHQRAQQARLAEKSIAELGVMFHKMSSLIVAQGETLERIEDDVESAGLDIDAGHDELVKVYGMTKGNRGLILKVFGVLIFLIIFMKLY